MIISIIKKKMKINFKNVDQYFEIFVTLIDIGNTNQNLKKGIKCFSDINFIWFLLNNDKHFRKYSVCTIISFIVLLIN